MKLRPSILIFVLTLWSTSQIEGNPGAWYDPFTTGLSSCSSVGFFVNNYDCSKFYRCVDYEFNELGGSGGWVPPTKGWSPPPKVGWTPSKRSVSSEESIRSKRSVKGWAAPPTGWSKRNLLVRYDFDCPCGLVFDEEVKVCVYPDPGGCAGWSSASPPKVSCVPPPSKGWSPPKGSSGPYNKGGPAPKAGWAPPTKAPKAGWSGRPGRSFTPARSYEIIYDNRNTGSSEEF